MAGDRLVTFDNTGPFLEECGFDHATSAADARDGFGGTPNTWGWGVQDNETYRAAFRLLDRDRELAFREEKARPKFFTLIATISHHFPFDHVPAAQRFLYPQPATREEQIANSIHLADR